GTLSRLRHARLRDAPRSPDGGVIADYVEGFDDPERLAAELSSSVGVVDHGLFPGSGRGPPRRRSMTARPRAAPDRRSLPRNRRSPRRRGSAARRGGAHVAGATAF